MDKLDEIMVWKRRELESRIRPVPLPELERAGAAVSRPVSFRDALVRAEGLSVIAEIKRRSPSAGSIRAGIAAAEQARRYYNAGADAMSVLTDERYFGGSIRDLWEVADLIGPRADARPLLRKDFFVHPIQVLEAVEAGAAAILVIVRALSDDEIRQLQEAAAAASLDALFEVHDDSELERALRFDPAIVGVNNRDLKRFVTDLGIAERLLPEIPDGVVAVGESGITGPDDARRMREAGADAVLVGEALMRTDDPDELIEAMRRP